MYENHWAAREKKFSVFLVMVDGNLSVDTQTHILSAEPTWLEEWKTTENDKYNHSR